MLRPCSRGRARHYACSAPAPAPSRCDSPYIDVEPTKKPLLRTGAVVRLRAFFSISSDPASGPFGICDAFDAKSNLWAVRFFGEKGLDGLERSGHVKKAKVRYLEPGSKAGIKFVDLGHYASAISEGPATLPEPPVNAGVAGGGGEAEAQLAAEDAARREAFEKLRAEHVVAPVTMVDTPGLGQGYKYLKRSETKSYSYYKKFGFAGRGARCGPGESGSWREPVTYSVPS